jgi:hypothetical protein
MTEEFLAIRRKLEAKLVKKNDRNVLQKGEFYYLLDCNWLKRWTEFTTNGGPFPGKISSIDLVDKSNKALPNLKAKVHYRGVIPLVYFIFISLHGWDRSPHVCRYTIDIEAPAVPIAKIFDIQYAATQDARILVHDIRQKWTPEPIEEEDEEDKRVCTFCCCGYPIECLSLKKEHLEAFIYWMIMCWSKARKDRSNIKYSQYTPLSTDSKHGFSNHGSNHGGKNSTPNNSSHGQNSTHGKKIKQSKSLSSNEVKNEDIDDDGSSEDDKDTISVGLADKSYEASNWSLGKVIGQWWKGGR